MAKKWLTNVGLILLVVFAIFLVGYSYSSQITGSFFHKDINRGECGNFICEPEEGETCPRDCGDFFGEGSACTEGWECSCNEFACARVYRLADCDTGTDYGCRWGCNAGFCDRTPRGIGQVCTYNYECRNRQCVNNRCFGNVCGNGILEPTELCDDGNRRPGDGCDAFCFIEVPSSGIISCGNGVVDSREQCDDSGICTTDGRTACTSVSDCPIVRGQRGRCATRSGDGCDFNCRIEERVEPECHDCWNFNENRNSSFYGVAVDSNGNSYVIGNETTLSRSYSPPHTSVLFSYDGCGNPRWYIHPMHFNYNLSYSSDGRDVVISDDGNNLYAVGSFATSNRFNRTGNIDIWLAGYNVRLDVPALVWQRNYSRRFIDGFDTFNTFDWGHSIDVSSSGDVYITGAVDYFDSLNIWPGGRRIYSAPKIFVARYNPNGGLVWENTMTNLSISDGVPDAGNVDLVVVEGQGSRNGVYVVGGRWVGKLTINGDLVWNVTIHSSRWVNAVDYSNGNLYISFLDQDSREVVMIVDADDGNVVYNGFAFGANHWVNDIIVDDFTPFSVHPRVFVGGGYYGLNASLEVWALSWNGSGYNIGWNDMYRGNFRRGDIRGIVLSESGLYAVGNILRDWYGSSSAVFRKYNQDLEVCSS